MELPRSVVKGIPTAQDKKLPGKTFCICHFMARGDCSKFKVPNDCWAHIAGRSDSMDCAFRFEEEQPKGMDTKEWYKVAKGVCLSAWEKDCDDWVKQVVENKVCGKAKKLKEKDDATEGDADLQKLFTEQPERIWYNRIGHGRGGAYLNSQAKALVDGYPDTKVFFVDDAGCSVFDGLQTSDFSVDKTSNPYSVMFNDAFKGKLRAGQSLYVSGNQCISGKGSNCNGIDCHVTQSPISFDIGRTGTRAFPHPCSSDRLCSQADEKGVCQYGDKVIAQTCCTTGLPPGKSSGSGLTWRINVSDCKMAPNYELLSKHLYHVPEGIDHIVHQQNIHKAIEMVSTNLPFMTAGTDRQENCPKGTFIDDKKLVEEVAEQFTVLDKEIVRIRKSYIWRKDAAVEKLFNADGEFVTALKELKKKYEAGKLCVAQVK